MFSFSVKIRHGRMNNSRWSNPDLDPVEPKYRVWSSMTYLFFWISASLDPQNFTKGSSLVSTGMSWQQAFGTALVAQFIAALYIVFLSRPASKTHVGYPTYMRSCFGFLGSLVFVAMRLVLSIIFYGYQTYLGSSCLDVGLHAIFGHKWYNIPNHIPASQGITSRALLAFGILWIAQFPVNFIHPRRIRYLFYVTALTAPWVYLGIFIWSIKSVGGVGKFAAAGKGLSGTGLSWSMVNGINSILGTAIPIAVNQADIAKFAKTSKAVGWPQFFGMFISQILCIFFGIASASAFLVNPNFKQAYWNPWLMLEAILNAHWHASVRFAVAISCFILVLTTVSQTVAFNAIPAGSDLNGIFPKHFSIVRGQIACALIAFACVPWRLFSSGSGFLTFLGSYNIYFGSAAGIILADYYIIRKGNLHVPSLYDSKGIYRFQKGFNLKSLSLWFVGFVMCLPGFAGQFPGNKVSAAASHLYSLGWLTTTAIGFFGYILFCRIWPNPIWPSQFNNRPTKWESLNDTDGFFPEEEGVYGPNERNVVESDFEEKEIGLDKVGTT